MITTIFKMKHANELFYELEAAVKDPDLAVITYPTWTLIFHRKKLPPLENAKMYDGYSEADICAKIETCIEAKTKNPDILAALYRFRKISNKELIDINPLHGKNLPWIKNIQIPEKEE